MNLSAALPTFIAESRELIASMEEALLQLERAPGDTDALNAAFRAMHTIKGSAGLFGLDDIVGFAHVAENALDRARDGELRMDERLSALLLECGDHLLGLVARVAGDEEAADPDGDSRGTRLRAALAGLGGGDAGPAQPAASSAAVAGEARPFGSELWHISLRFGPEVLRNGMDPAAFLRFLATLGEAVHTVCLWDGMPEAEAMDPERCYLGFEIAFRSEASRVEIEGVFEFVRDDCRIAIVPPRARIEEYLALIEALPEGNARIGEILVAAGALTAAELERALARQASATAHVPVGVLLVEDGGLPQGVLQAGLDKQQRSQERRRQDGKFVRVDAAKLEALIDQVGEMVIAGASAALHARKHGDGVLNEAVSQLERLVEEVRDSALSLRMVEIGDTFLRFQRVVRDLSHELGKEIELVATGNDTELDKLVVEKINDPLLHLVRNAIDHGVEPAAERLARGKPAAATIALNAYHESGSVVIEVSDDGGGLKRERILAKGIERGLVAPGQSLGDKEVFNLIFEPGFSTAEQVTNLSGRGVGMDVVRRNIEALRGTIEIDSREGAGTTVRMRLPLTLAIIDGFLVGVGGACFVVPLDMVVECLALSEADATASGARQYINLRGEVLPFVRLRDLFGVEGAPARRENVVVVNFAGQKAGLVVDRLLGECQTVIKPLGVLFRQLRGISGSTILGSGEVALILDVPATVQHAVDRDRRESSGAKTRSADALPQKASIDN